MVCPAAIGHAHRSAPGAVTAIALNILPPVHAPATLLRGEKEVTLSHPIAAILFGVGAPLLS